MPRTRKEIQKERLDVIETALKEAGIKTFERDYETIHIPSIQDAVVRCRATFESGGDIWSRHEKLEKPRFVVDPRWSSVAFRRINCVNPVKAVSRCLEIIRAAEAKTAAVNSWAVKNEAVSRQIADLVGIADSRAKDFGWGVRFRTPKGGEGPGLLEVYRPGSDQEDCHWADKKISILFPAFNGEGRRIPADSAPVEKLPSFEKEPATVSELASAFAILADVARKCDETVKDIQA